VSVLIGLVTGFLAARLLWTASAGLWASDVLARTNYRARQVPTGAGIIVGLVVLVVEAGRVVVGALGVGPEEGPGTGRALVLVAVVGFAGLGFVDDVLGTDDERGWRSHLRALGAGRLSAGGLKLVGGGALALVLAALAGEDPGLGRVLVDGAVIALAANLANAFDRAPGRAVKVVALAWLPLALVAGTGAVGLALAPAMGAAFGLLAEDLGERLMLGDAGANALGAVLGVGAVLILGPWPRLALAVVLAALNLAAEMVSFSRVIDRVAPLRLLDRLGRAA
jgi:UDP-GlcNAc:undecaprenyl-phosphate/decaprenyl-phosphate GlcNAc-1-phosphate transferase